MNSPSKAGFPTFAIEESDGELGVHWYPHRDPGLLFKWRTGGYGTLYLHSEKEGEIRVICDMEDREGDKSSGYKESDLRHSLFQLVEKEFGLDEIDETSSDEGFILIITLPSDKRGTTSCRDILETLAIHCRGFLCGAAKWQVKK